VLITSPVPFPVAECFAAVVICVLWILCFLRFGVRGALCLFCLAMLIFPLQQIVAFVVHHHDHCMD